MGNYEQLLGVFVAIIYEALPFVVLGVVIAGILEEFVPQQLMSGFFRGELPEAQRHTVLGRVFGPLAGLLKHRPVAIAFGGFLGLIFPMCECGIIPIMRRLIRKGVPLSVCVCYLLCGPIINVVVLLSTYVAFNYPSEDYYLFRTGTPVDGALMMVLLRAGLAFVIGYVTSTVVEWQYRRRGDSLLHPSLIVRPRPGQEDGTQEKKSLFRRLGNISETALHDFVDIMAFLILGAALAASGRALMETEALGGVIQSLVTTPYLAVLTMMFLAVLFCLCSEADAFVAANFPMAWPPASKLGFLLLGPMMDLKLYVMYTRIFRQRLIWTIILTVAIQVFAYTTLIHYLWPDNGYPQVFFTTQSAAP